LGWKIREINTTFLKIKAGKTVRRDNIKTDFKKSFLVDGDEPSGYNTLKIII
jgi:hypothetical protein